MLGSVYQKIKNEFQNKKILVVGLGLQAGGVGVARFFAELGAQVRVTDLKTTDQLTPSINQLKKYSINYTLGGHQVKDFLEADLIIKGPSVPWSLKEIKQAQKKGVPIETELSFVMSYCPTKTIGITGTRGKSTTTMMIYEVLKKNNLSVYLGGGLPKISTINLLKKLKKDDWLVMECSSWALSGLHQKKISPPIAVFTSFYPDHLNYYHNLEDYLWDKKAIYLYQKKNNFLIAHQSLKKIILNDQPQSQIFFYQKDLFPKKLKYLSGDHNQENASAAFLTAKILGLDLKKTTQTLVNFSGLPFRQQVIGQKNQVIFINDTTSTTPIATQVAIKTLAHQPIVLILGGQSKNLPFKDLLPQLKKVNKIVLLNGSFTQEILPYLKKEFPQKITNVFQNLKQAVKTGYQISQEIAKKTRKKTYLLFSPGATSFAMFNNEFDRGRQFNQIIKKIIKNNF